MADSRFKVVVTDHPFPNMEIEQRELGKIGADLVVRQCGGEDEVLDLTRDADAVLNTYAKITSTAIREMTRCRIIARYGIGVDNVDVKAASQRGIVVTNVPDYCVDEVSDQALTLLLALERKVVPLDKTVRTGVWSYQRFRPIFRLRGRALGLVGFGKIARRLAEKAAALGLRIKAYDPCISNEMIKAAGAEPVSLETLLKTSDYVSIHCPLTPETRNMFGERLFSQMKPTAYLINTARGPIVDEQALYEAIKSKRLAGAALDVLCSEREPVRTPLLELEEVIITPHTAFYSEEAMVEQRLKAVTQVVKVLTGRSPDYPVNPEVLRSKEDGHGKMED